jgi:adenylate cyclase
MSWFEYRNPDEKSLEVEIMTSDRLRAAVVGTAFLVAAVVVAVVGWNAGLFVGGALDFLSRVSYPVAVVTLAVLGIYEWVYRAIQGRLLNRGLRLPLPPRLFNAAVEVSVPTFALALLATVVPGLEALDLPPVFLYFFFLALATLRLDPWLALWAGAVAGLEYGALSWFLLAGNPGPLPWGTLAPHLSKAGMLVVTGGILAFVTQQIRGRVIGLLSVREQQSRMAAIFGQHVSPAVMEKLLTQKTSLESEVRKVTVMFLDIRNFTTFSESRRPDEVVAYLNRLFAFMVDIVNARQGIINKFLGDGFMAVFGAPLDDGRCEANALGAALEISDRLREALAAGEVEPTRIGIGLHSGSAVTGNVGSLQRQEYTIIGDVVNLASRIESHTKVAGAEILVSQTAWEGLPTADRPEGALPLGPVTVKGREAPVELVRIR